MEIKRKIIYLFLMAGTCYLGLLYHSSALLGLALLELLVLAASGIFFWMFTGKLHASLYFSTSVAEKYQEFQVGIFLENASRFPVARVRGTVVLSNHFYPFRTEAQLFGMAAGKSHAQLTAGVTAEQCGWILLEGKELRVRDYLGLWSRAIPLSGREQMTVLPLDYEAGIQLSAETRDFLAESEAYDPRRAGDDPAEIFQIREYRAGDRLQAMHWKASARMDDLMVKDFGLPVGKSVVLFFDMLYDPQEGYGRLDEFLEAGLALSRGLLRAGCEHYAVWFDREKQDLERLVIAAEEDHYRLINQLFRSGPCPGSFEMEEAYREKYRGETWQQMIRINRKMEVWKNQQLELELGEDPRRILENGEWLV